MTISVMEVVKIHLEKKKRIWESHGILWNVEQLNSGGYFTIKMRSHQYMDLQITKSYLDNGKSYIQKDGTNTSWGVEGTQDTIRHFFLLKSLLHTESQHFFITLYRDINSSPPSAAYMHRSTGSTLVQIMACRLVGTKPLSEPMLEYCSLEP